MVQKSARNSAFWGLKSAPEKTSPEIKNKKNKKQNHLHSPPLDSPDMQAELGARKEDYWMIFLKRQKCGIWAKKGRNMGTTELVIEFQDECTFQISSRVTQKPLLKVLFTCTLSVAMMRHIWKLQTCSLIRQFRPLNEGDILAYLVPLSPELNYKTNALFRFSLGAILSALYSNTFLQLDITNHILILRN